MPEISMEIAWSWPKFHAIIWYTSIISGYADLSQRLLWNIKISSKICFWHLHLLTSYNKGKIPILPTSILTFASKRPSVSLQNKILEFRLLLCTKVKAPPPWWSMSHLKHYKSVKYRSMGALFCRTKKWVTNLKRPPPLQDWGEA